MPTQQQSLAGEKYANIAYDKSMKGNGNDQNSDYEDPFEYKNSENPKG